MHAQTVFHAGGEEPVDLTFPDPQSWFETLLAWGYSDFLELGSEDMGGEDLEAEDADTWQADLTVRTYAAEDDRAPYPYCAVLHAVAVSRVVFFPTVSDLFAFCNLAAPVLRLNYETRPKAIRGERYARGRDRFRALAGGRVAR